MVLRIVLLAQSDFAGTPRVLCAALAVMSEARAVPLAWEERRRRRARDLAYLETCPAGLLYQRWCWICPSLRLDPLDPDDESVSLRRWKHQLRRRRMEFKIFCASLLAVACSCPH